MVLKVFLLVAFALSLSLVDADTKPIRWGEVDTIHRLKRDTAVQSVDNYSLMFIDSIVNLLKTTLTRFTDQFVISTRNTFLSFFDATILGLTKITTQVEPPEALSSITSHTLNTLLKRGISYLTYVRDTIKNFFDVFISEGNRRVARSVSPDLVDQSQLRRFLLNMVNIIATTASLFVPPGFYPFVAIIQGAVIDLVNRTFPPPL